jgi:hypothetical protein
MPALHCCLHNKLYSLQPLLLPPAGVAIARRPPPPSDQPFRPVQVTPTRQSVAAPMAEQKSTPAAGALQQRLLQMATAAANSNRKQSVTNFISYAHIIHLVHQDVDRGHHQLPHRLKCWSPPGDSLALQKKRPTAGIVDRSPNCVRPVSQTCYKCVMWGPSSDMLIHTTSRWAEERWSV